MSRLILSLPLAVASPHTVYRFTVGTAETSVRQAAAGMLPRSGRDTEGVAVVPAAGLSWHVVTLPAGKALRGSALRAMLIGLLEERVLDDVQDLHFALQSNWQPGERAWVAVCHKPWLQGHLQALEAAQVPIHRVVPQLWPMADDAAPQWLATGTPQDSWLWVSSAHGVWGLPLAAAKERLSAAQKATAQLYAEPAVAEWAEQQLQLKPHLLHPAEHLHMAAQSDWDLAQFDLAATGSTRWLKALGRLRQTLWQSPAWRPARWGLAVLLASQLLGLNAWAWKLQADLRQRQASLAQVVTQTFPEIQVVVDAPLQMRREVQRLQQATGQPASDGLEPLLAAIGQTLPAGMALNHIDFQNGQLRLREEVLSEAQAVPMQAPLQALHYQLRREGADWVLAPTSKRGAP